MNSHDTGREARGSVPHAQRPGNHAATTRALGLFLAAAVTVICSSCRVQSAKGWILTEVPAAHRGTNSPAPRDELDLRYPAGSRIVAVAGARRTVLSGNLFAAGDPIAGHDGFVYFCGKAGTKTEWQVYRTGRQGGRPVPVTKIAGGACGPALLANGEIVFSSPVRKAGEAQEQAGHSPAPGGGPGSAAADSALFAQANRGSPRQLTFGGMPASDPTVMRDGRILFVSCRASHANGAGSGGALFTINSDGTELAALALNGDGAPRIRKPRELPDRRIAFLASDNGKAWRAETIQMARPFASRAPLAGLPVLSYDPANPWTGCSAVLPEETAPGIDRAADNWRVIEAVPAAVPPKPMGHLSTVDPSETTGTVLCLDSGFTRAPNSAGKPAAVRVLAGSPGNEHSLGTVPVHIDGSFMARVPADKPLGFETLDAAGAVLGRVAPSIWVRPGENRTCVGCHEPYNRSPRNARPIAANFPPTQPLADAARAQMELPSGSPEKKRATAGAQETARHLP